MRDIQLYNQFKSNLLNALRTKRDILVIQDFRAGFESLFEISNDNDKLYRKILDGFEMIGEQRHHIGNKLRTNQSNTIIIAALTELRKMEISCNNADCHFHNRHK